MIEVMDKAMLALQAAAAGRKLYGPAHPAARRQLAQAVELLEGLLGASPRLKLARFNNALLFQDTELPSCTHLSETILPRLAAHGTEWVEFHRGVDEAELIAFLDQLQGPPSETNALGTDHVRVGQLGRAGAGGEGDAEAAEALALLGPADQVEQLKRLLQQVQTGDPPRNHLADLAESIRLTVAVGEDVCQQLIDVKSHDEYTFVHTVNVGILSAALGESIGMTEGQVFELTVAALLHDIGKQRTPVGILNKPSPLEAAERRRMELHPVEGAAILLRRRGVPDMAPIVAFEHHANLDGSGYPTLDRVGRPHLASQIVRIVDVFDALRTHRPYRAALEASKARGILLEGSGKWFEPDLLKVFLERVVKAA